MSSSSGGGDRPTVVRLLRETIVQLCRANAPFGGGRVEIDGIICITGAASGQELVVKVHEVLHDAVDPSRPGGPPYSGLFDRERYLSAADRSTSSGDVSVEVKRRRLDAPTTLADNVPMMSLAGPAAALAPHHSALYDYLSRFGLSSSPRVGGELDSRLAVKDLSLKSAARVRRREAAADRGATAASPARRPASPSADDRQMVGHRPHRAPLPLYSERWSPNRPIPAIPQCFVCGLRFSSAEALGEHNETVHSIFTCLCCFKTFTSRSNLERHSRLHTGHRPYACPVCGKTFSRKDHLSNHATKHAYKCGTCTRRCSDQSALADHYRLEHPGLVLAAVCAYCNKGFSSVELYEEHVKVHPQFHVSAADGDQAPPPVPAPPARHQCQMCGFEAMDRVCLVQHQQLMHYAPMSLLRDAAYDNSPMTSTAERPSYRCVVCPFTSGTLLGLRQHEATHVYGTHPQHPAFELSRQLQPSSSLRAGDGQLAGADGVECHHCGQQFDSYTTLCQHLQELSQHTDVSFLVSAQHRDKRKQKQPKPVMAADDEDEVVNVVSPESEKKSEEEHSSERPVSDADVKHSLDSSSASSPGDEVAPEIRMEPIRSIMNRSSIPAMMSRRDDPASPPSLRRLYGDSVSGRQETGRAATPPPRLVKRETSSIDDGDASPSPRDLSNNSIPDLASERSLSAHSSPGDLAANNNNNGDGKEGADSTDLSVKTEAQWMSSSMVEQTRCIVCGTEFSDFSEMEAHCLSEHSRSPCTYCPKTFAQKANRDRHMCLHTGDRPYGCPECGERFARGDKLKMHRVRTHGVLYSSYGARSSHRDRDGSRNHSASQSPMTLDAADPGTSTPTGVAAVNGGSAGQEADSPAAAAESDLHGSTSVLSGGEWIDLRIGVCRESTKLHSALTGRAHQLEPFPKREITDDEVIGGQQA